MSAKHTPGPWFVSAREVAGFSPWVMKSTPSGDLFIACMAAVRGEEIANARLIAAAPDLLEALQRLTDQVAGYGTTDAGLVQAARAAIARATDDMAVRGGV